MAQNTDSPLEPQLIKSCDKCSHIRICAVFRAVGPLLSKNWEEETRPIEPEELAIICKEFLSMAMVKILNGRDLR